MSSARPRTWRRWLPLSIGLVVLAGFALWWSAGFVIAHALERQLRNGGWPEARVEQAALALPNVVIDRVQFTAGEALVAEDVRVRVGFGIERVAIGRLHAEIGLTADGDWLLPGGSGATGDSVPLDMLPPGGIAVARADILISTPFAVIPLTLSDVAVRRVEDRAEVSAGYSLRLETPNAAVDVNADANADGNADASSDSPREDETRAPESAATIAARDAVAGDLSFGLQGYATAELGADRSAQARFRIDAGELAAGGIEVAGLTGNAAAVLPAEGPPTFELSAGADATRAAGLGLGALAIEAAWRDETARFAVTTPRPDLADVSIEGEASLGDEASGAKLSGRVLLGPASPAKGLVTFDAELATARAATPPAATPPATQPPAATPPATTPLAAEPQAATPPSVPQAATEPPDVEPRDAGVAGALLRGRLRMEGRDFVYPGLLTQGALNLTADVQASTDEVRVAMSDARVEMAPEPDALPALARELEGRVISLELASEDASPPTLRWTFAEQSAELVGRLDARADDARVATTLRAEAGAAAKAELSGFTARNVPWGGLVLGAENFDGAVEHRSDEWRIEGVGTFTAAGEIASTRLEAATLEWAGTVTGTPQRIVLEVDECIRGHAEAVEVDGATIANLAPLCVAPGDDRVLLTYDADEARTEFAFSIDEQPLAFRIATGDGDSAYAVEGRWPSVAASGVTSEAGIATLSARLSGGALSSRDLGAALSGIAGSAELRDSAITSTTLRVARIEALATPAPIAPVGLELTAERADDVLSFDAILSDELGTFVLEAVGTQEEGRARAAIRLHPVRFVSGATEVADLSPLLAEHVADASGTLELAGDVEWSGAELTGMGTVSVRELGATVAGVRIAGLSTETRLTSLVPLVTAPEQTVEVAEVDLGMPLEDGIAVFDLGADGALAIRRVEFAFAGGRLYAEPFTIDSGSADDIGFVLRAEAVELSHFLELSQIEGLTGTGVLSGRVPVRLADGGIRLDEGVLAAETDGVLRYTPSNLPDFLRGDDVRSRMLREVLTNFQYEELSLAVSGESMEGGQQRLTLDARGANPDFLEGHPIELSFNFQGPLLGAVRSAVDLSDAAQLEHIFEQRETENEENSR